MVDISIFVFFVRLMFIVGICLIILSLALVVSSMVTKRDMSVMLPAAPCLGFVLIFISFFLFSADFVLNDLHFCSEKIIGIDEQTALVQKYSDIGSAELLRKKRILEKNIKKDEKLISMLQEGSRIKVLFKYKVLEK